MNVVDSSGWLEYFAQGPNTTFFAGPIEAIEQLLVSAINIYEVARRIEQQYDRARATRFLLGMHRGTVVVVDEFLALRAVELSIQHKLPMADSMILATAQIHNGTLWTQDAHFAGIAGGKYIAKP